jgi:excisionase family DNA binding protein
MFALITFVLGLFFLIKGAFRFGSRAVAQPQARTIALSLMAPLVVYFCASYIMLSNNIQFNDDGTFEMPSGDVFMAVYERIGSVELISVGLALLLTAYLIYGSPRVGSPQAMAAAQPKGSSAPPTLNRTPDIMTVAEAAAYMRVSEADVLSLIDQGKLGAARIGDTYRIARIAIEDFMRIA